MQTKFPAIPFKLHTCFSIILLQLTSHTQNDKNPGVFSPFNCPHFYPCSCRLPWYPRCLRPNTTDGSVRKAFEEIPRNLRSICIPKKQHHLRPFRRSNEKISGKQRKSFWKYLPPRSNIRFSSQKPAGSRVQQHVLQKIPEERHRGWYKDRKEDRGHRLFPDGKEQYHRESRTRSSIWQDQTPILQYDPIYRCRFVFRFRDSVKYNLRWYSMHSGCCTCSWYVSWSS